MVTLSEQIQQIYIGLLGRVANQQGHDYWEEEISTGKLTIEQFRANIVNEQPDYAEGLGSMDREQAIITLYDNLFQRAPEPAGLEYWLNGGGSSVNFDQLVLALINGASERDREVLELKVEVSQLPSNGAGGKVLVVTEDTSLAELLGTDASDLSGIQQIVLDRGATLSIEDNYAELFSARILSVKYHEVDAQASVELNVSSDLLLSEAIGPELGIPGLKLKAVISGGASLTISAEELEVNFARQGIRLSEEQSGSITITDAGLGFDPFDHSRYFGLGGTLSETPAFGEAVTVERNLYGHERAFGSLDAQSLSSGVYTLTANQIDRIGVENFSLADSAEATINVLDLGGQRLDLDVLQAAGFDIGVVTIDGQGAELHESTNLGGADEVRVEAEFGPETFDLTAAQFMGIESGVIIEEGTEHPVNVVVDQLAMLQSADVDINLSNVAVSGSTELFLWDHYEGALSDSEFGGHEVVFAESADLGDFSVILVDYGDTLPADEVVFSTAVQAERPIQVYGEPERNTHVIWDFSDLEGTKQEGDIDLSGYAAELGYIELWGALYDEVGEEVFSELPVGSEIRVKYPPSTTDQIVPLLGQPSQAEAILV
ncbi:hypothetical protein HBA55_11180 [Pseudomaricurvus alkylphenolicus]|uniref:hypothetical protein n=1 Tax=Pseudomaricurvus alkylphenolicus TaxID=1306991 RepID=UPI0014210CF3|nr:hypothetical protein [Pseudomaricurvus alkylphenolicus]NIB40152.1 hypothetical protein [Pseudomaricurvus alkylphenolicus]